MTRACGGLAWVLGGALLVSGCSNSPFCGDGKLQEDLGEACDDGRLNADNAACTSSCQIAICGDGLVGPNETCDEGAANADTGSCTSSCIQAACGDGFVQTGVEQCDDGSANSDTLVDACRTNCENAGCGDGVIDTGESCDDSGESATCDVDCTPATCGDAVVNATALEDCDDGTETAMCDGDCTLVVCGDNRINTLAGEGCDDGNATLTDTCPDGPGGSCITAFCGDGFLLDTVEECDDGNMTNDDACRNTCFDGSEGDPCAAGADCADDVCGVGSTCLTPCGDDDNCGAGRACSILENISGGPSAACTAENVLGAELGERCADDGDCRTGLCDAGFCTEICQGCAPGAACTLDSLNRFGADINLGLCKWQLASADLTFGPIPTDAMGSAEITFDVPVGTGSFTVVAVDERAVGDYAQRAGFYSLEAPDSTVLIDSTDGMSDLNPYGVPYPGAASVVVPSTDDSSANPQAGTYRLKVGVFETMDFITYTPVVGEIEEVTVHFEPTTERGGILDLNLFFAPGTGITAASAPGSAYVQTVLGEVDFYLRTFADARLGEVVFFDLPDTYDVIANFDEIRELCQLESRPGPHGTSANVFVVVDMSGTGAAGVSGGVPGPPGLFQTPASGIVTYDIAASAVSLGATVAHELGHFLGLKHTSQINFATNMVIDEDPLSDTPVCDEMVLPNFNMCADSNNLMFPVFNTSGATFSDAQVSVMRGSSLLYEVPRDDACPSAPAVVDMSAAAFATGNTAALTDNFAAACGGTGNPERVHLYRLRTPSLTRLDVHVLGTDFAPVGYVRSADCNTAEVACDSEDAGSSFTLSVDSPTPGDWFIVVDGRDGSGGRFTLEVEEVP